ncbi:hypothetical protein ELY15_14445 [Legionella sp. km772]|nr:hypothetical protein ELY15_14445 [Legionella sp. km772]
MGFIIKVSKESNYFKGLCEQDKYKKLWDIVYSQIGLHLTADAKTPISFYVHDNPNLDSFSLAKGAYLFYVSDLLRKELKQDYSATEIKLLKEAIPLKSIHATQRYNEIIFHKIAHDQLEDDEDKATLFKEAIANCKQQLELHGSYAYMMLAEAYFHYATWAYSQDQTPLAQKSIAAAISACTLAEKHLEKSSYSIHNASLGRGLAVSNSFNLESPLKAKTFLEDWLANQATTVAPRM